MFYHLTPQIYTPYVVELIDLSIPEFNLTLKGAIDLTVRKPYPNKWYKVGCSKASRWAIKGILVESDELIREFTMTTRWAICAQIATMHKVTYKVLDGEFGAVSDQMILWYGCGPEFGNWSRRWPSWADGKAPVNVQPRMVLTDERGRACAKEEVDPATGLIALRHEVFEMPTIEPDRIFQSQVSDRLPSKSMAFKTGPMR